MRIITVPADIIVDPPEPVAAAIRRLGDKLPKTFTFQRYALEVWLNDPRAIKGGFVQQCRWTNVVHKFLTAQPGDTIALEDIDFSTLREIAVTPQVVPFPLIAMYLTAFTEAVFNAAVEP